MVLCADAQTDRGGTCRRVHAGIDAARLAHLLCTSGERWAAETCRTNDPNQNEAGGQKTHLEGAPRDSSALGHRPFQMGAVDALRGAGAAVVSSDEMNARGGSFDEQWSVAMITRVTDASATK